MHKILTCHYSRLASGWKYTKKKNTHLKQFKIMKTLFTVLFLISVLIYSAKPTVTLKPFSISFEQPIIPFAILTLCLAIFLFQYDSVEKTKKELIDKYYNEGLNDGFDTAVKMLEKELNNKK